VAEECAHFVTCEDKALRLHGADQVLEPWHIVAEELAIEEEQGG
jgi:hypothetical protein